MEIAYKFTPKEIQKLSKFKKSFINFKQRKYSKKMENTRFI